MALLTPPNTSHRMDKEKENKYSAPLAGPSSRTVVWAIQDTFHSLSTPLKGATVSSKKRPNNVKSILKKSAVINIPTTEDATTQREVTPEPSDPLVDLYYLDHPVQQILAEGMSNDEGDLGEIVEGYNVLACRLRSCVSDSTDADASWPLFQPLRKNAQPFVNAIIRDLGRALVDPISHRRDAKEGENDNPKFTLPSPQKSPMKKKGGLNEEQVKYARDLCTTCHSVIKALSVILSFPAIFSVFTEKQLNQILTTVLAIPLADELPTPNSRKTCALAIWLIQVQRLPASVLRPAADRIAYALQRGMDGELGKEGKKGSVNDGLKAIYDLSMHLPDVFIPAFTPVLPSVLANLLAPTLALRVQACHALGGFAFASTTIPQSTVHTKLSKHVASYLTNIPPPTTKSPTKPTEAPIVRTLRTTLNCVDPVHAAQGPVWGISVLASFIALLGSRLCSDSKANRIISTLLGLGLKHKKSSVRALCCITWRPVTWAYFQPPLPQDPEDEDEEEENSSRAEQVKAIYYKIVSSVVDMQAGIGIVAAHLGTPTPSSEEPVDKALDILFSMTKKPNQSCDDAVEALRHMTSFYDLDQQEECDPWNPSLLLPKSLFCSSPGLLTAEFKSLSSAVRPIFNQLPMIHDIRPLLREELTMPNVYTKIVRAWRTALERLELYDDYKVPDNLVEVWTNLLKANVAQLQATGDDEGLSGLVFDAARTIAFIAQERLDFRPKAAPQNIPMAAMEAACAALDSDDTIPDLNMSATCSEEELRVRVIQRLWTVMKEVTPSTLLESVATNLITNLAEVQISLVPKDARLTDGFEDVEGERSRDAWVVLCLDILSACDISVFKYFWGYEVEKDDTPSSWKWSKDFTQAIWRTSALKWAENDGSLEAAIVLLGLPFSDRHSWGLCGGDFSAWEDLLTYATGKALDEGMDSYQVLDRVADHINRNQTPGLHPATSTRLIDSVFSNIEAEDMRDIPARVLKLVADTLSATYPPKPRNKQFSMWMLRSLTSFIEHCPTELCLRILQILEDGICDWLSDDAALFSEHEFNYDILPLYQHILVRVQALPKSFDTLRALENILDSIFINRAPPGAVEAFTEYWKNTYARASPPEQWSEAIMHALQAIGIEPLRSRAPASPLAPAFIPLLRSPRTPVSSSFSTPPSAIIRREALSRPSSPQRPQKVFSGFPIVPTTPMSPIRRRTNSSCSSRTPLSTIQLCISPGKRRRLSHEKVTDHDDEKENALVEEVAPVLDRIANPQSTGNKRQLDNEDDAGPCRPMKKLKGRMKPKAGSSAQKSRFLSPVPSVASSNESEDERWVESNLIPFLASDASNPLQQNAKLPAVGTRTRKGTAVNSISVDGLAFQVQLANEQRIKSQDRVETPKKKIDLTKMLTRRAVSIPDSLMSTTMNRKRKRRDSTSDCDVDLYDACSSDPLPSLSLPLRKNAKTYTLSIPDSDVSVCPTSSDDDPHLGQVTPHHLISPALIRKAYSDKSPLTKSGLTIMQELFGDDIPNSDDSNTSGSESDSPIKDFMARQLQRTGSASKITT